MKVLEWNKLCDEMENVVIENKHLRKISNVPENFGIDLEGLKIGDRITSENLRGRIRVLQKELEDAEEERARSKFKLINTNFSEMKNSNSTYFFKIVKKYDQLTPEQKVQVEEFIISLLLNKNPNQEEKYDLKKEIQTLKIKIEILEKQNTNLKFHVQEKINNLYEPKLIEANKPKFEFKKIDLNERIQQFNPKLININPEICLENDLENQKIDCSKKENDDKICLNNSISNPSTNCSVKDSINSVNNSIRSYSNVNEKRDKLTIQEKLRFTSGKFYHNNKK